MSDDSLDWTKEYEPHYDGGPAFPEIAANGLGHVSSGMTTRTYIATQAMASLIIGEGSTPEKTSIMAMEYADALIAELSK